MFRHARLFSVTSSVVVADEEDERLDVDPPDLEFSDDDDPLHGLATTRESDLVDNAKQVAKLALKKSDKGKSKVGGGANAAPRRG